MKRYYCTPDEYKRHFADREESQRPEEYHFEQLRLDMRWAVSAADTFMERDGLDVVEALAGGFGALAARRWSRFKNAEKENDRQRASEMKAFATFWYGLAEEIRKKKQHEV